MYVRGKRPQQQFLLKLLWATSLTGPEGAFFMETKYEKQCITIWLTP